MARPKGSKNKRKEVDIRRILFKNKVDPIGEMCNIIKGIGQYKKATISEKSLVARELASYLYPKMKTVEVKGLVKHDPVSILIEHALATNKISAGGVVDTVAVEQSMAESISAGDREEN